MTKVKSYDLRQLAYTTTGTVPNYELTIPREDLTSLQDQLIFVKFHDVSTSNTTLNINGLGAISLVDNSGNSISQIQQNDVIPLVYDGTNFVAIKNIGGQTSISMKVFDMSYTDTGDYDLYEFSGTGITQYSEEDFFVVKLEHTNTSGVSKINIDGLGEKFLYTPKGDNLNESVLEIDNTYLIRYDISLDAFTIMATGDVNITNINENFVDLKAYDTAIQSFSGWWSDPDSFKYGYDGERYLHMGICNAGIAYSVKWDTLTDTEVTHYTGRDNGIDQDSIVSYKDGYVYMTERGGNIYKINADTYTLETQITLAGTGRNVHAGNNYIRYGNDQANGLYKLDKNLNLISQISGTNAPSDTGRIFEYGNYVYFLVDSGYFYQIDINTNIVINSLSISGIKNFIITDGGHAIITTTGGIIYEYDINFNLISQLDLGETLYDSYSFSGGGIVDTKKGYVLINSQSGKFFKVGYPNLYLIGSPLVITSTQEMALAGNYIYTTKNGTASIYKIGTDILQAPEPGYYRLYFKSDGKLYRMDSTGAEELIGTQS